MEDVRIVETIAESGRCGHSMILRRTVAGGRPGSTVGAELRGQIENLARQPAQRVVAGRAPRPQEIDHLVRHPEKRFAIVAAALEPGEEPFPRWHVSVLLEVGERATGGDHARHHGDDLHDVLRRRRLARRPRHAVIEVGEQDGTSRGLGGSSAVLAVLDNRNDHRSSHERSYKCQPVTPALTRPFWTAHHDQVRRATCP